MNSLFHQNVRNKSPLKETRLLAILLLVIIFFTRPVAANESNTTLIFNKPLDTEISRLLIKRLNHAYNAIGVEIKVIDFDHKSALTAANAGELDGQIGRVIGISTDYPNLVASHAPLMHLNLVLLTNKSCGSCQLSHLKTISHNASYPFAQKYIEQENYQGEVIASTNLMSQLHMLRNNTIDGILVLEYLLDHHIGDQAFDFFERKIVSQKPIHHYLHKKHTAILAKLDQQLMQNSWAKLEHKKPK